MINVLTIGFDKYVSDITFIRLEDETELSIRNYNFACVMVRGDSLDALAMYKALFKQASNFLLKLPLHIINIIPDTVFDCTEFNNYPWPEGFGYADYNVSKDLVLEEMEVIALRDGSKIYQAKIFLTSNIKELLQARVKLSEINLNLAIKEHKLNLTKLDSENKKN